MFPSLNLYSGSKRKMMTVLCDVESLNGKSRVGEEGPRVLEMDAVRNCDCHLNKWHPEKTQKGMNMPWEYLEAQ